jgi:hypothetical protein
MLLRNMAPHEGSPPSPTPIPPGTRVEVPIRFYENSAELIALLPAAIDLNGYGAFADGGTVSLACELSDSTELRFNLPPAKCVLYPDRNPQLFLQIYYADSREPETHEIAIRSELEFQVVGLLKNSGIDYRRTRLQLRAMTHYGYPVDEIDEEKRGQYNDEIRAVRDRIVAFVESDDYIRLNVVRDNR